MFNRINRKNQNLNQTEQTNRILNGQKRCKKCVLTWLLSPQSPCHRVLLSIRWDAHIKLLPQSLAENPCSVKPCCWQWWVLLIVQKPCIPPLQGLLRPAPQPLQQPALWEGSKFSTSSPILIFLLQKSTVKLVDGKWYFLVTLICISLMTNDVEQSTLALPGCKFWIFISSSTSICPLYAIFALISNWSCNFKYS